MKSFVNIDELIEIVQKGGGVKTGVDVHNSRGVLLIEKNIVLKSVNALLTLKQNGLLDVPVDHDNEGGAWDKNGKLIEIQKASPNYEQPKKEPVATETQKKVEEINVAKKEANIVHQRATENMRKVIDQIKETGGEFDQNIIESTVDEIFLFLTKKGHAFSYLAKELFSFDDYLDNHSVNVCTLGTAILLRFNEHFGELVNGHLNQLFMNNNKLALTEGATSYILYYPDELKEMAMGLFLHDIGKVLVIDQILNKQGKLGREELDLYKAHSYKFGAEILKKNNIQNAFIQNIVKHHHAALYRGEKKAYPPEKLPIEIPPYVKICKLTDCFDAMTSKRSHKDADNPVFAITEIFRGYAGKEDVMLQLILHAFVSVVGIYPSGSVVYLRNGQLAYILDSKGPICIPFTDKFEKPLNSQQEPFDVSLVEEQDIGLTIDRRRPPLPPKNTYHLLPEYIKGNSR